MNDEDDSYLRKYFQRNKAKQMQKVKEQNIRNHTTPKTATFRLKTNKFGILEVSKPPALILRSAQEHHRTNCEIRDENVLYLSTENALQSATSRRDSQTTAKLRSIKAAWPKKSPQTFKGDGKMKRKALSVVKSFLPKQQIDVSAISFSLYHDKLATRSEMAVENKGGVEENKSKVSQSLIADSISSDVKNVIPINDLYSLKHTNAAHRCDVTEQEKNETDFCENQQNSDSKNNSLLQQDQSFELDLHKHKSFDSVKTLQKSQEFCPTENNSESAYESSHRVECGPSNEREKVVESPREMKLLKLIKKVDNDISSGFADVISSLHSLCNNMEGPQADRGYVISKNSVEIDKDNHNEICNAQSHLDSTTAEASNAKSEMPQEPRFLENKSAKSEKHPQTSSRKPSSLKSIEVEIAEEKKPGDKRQELISQSKSPEMFPLKSSSSCDNPRTNKPPADKSPSDNMMETLRSASQSRTPVASGRKLKSRMTLLKSREKPKQLSHDETPVRGCKDSRLALMFDLPYRATLVKREMNVGQKIHKERTERESIFGVAKLVPLAPLKTPLKSGISSRSRKNSILEFFQSKMSVNEELESIKQQAYLKKEQKRCRNKKRKNVNKTKDLEISLDVKPLFLKSESKSEGSDGKITSDLLPSHRQNFSQPSLPHIHVSSSVDNGTPLSTPKIFRRRYDSSADTKTASSIAKSTTYNINEKSPLTKKIEKLKALQKSRKAFRQLPVFKIDEGSLSQFAESLDENISQEKTYKKTLPAILKLRKSILIRRDEWLGRLGETNPPITSRESPTFELDHKSLSCKQTQADCTEINDLCVTRAGESMSPTSFPLLRKQTPLLPSVMQELNENQQTIKWINKHGNVFEVTSENGKYGSISCYKDPASVCQYVFPKKNPTTDQSTFEKNQTGKQRKTFAHKMWQDLTETTWQPCPKPAKINQLRQMKRSVEKEEPDERLVVVYSNGLGNDVSFQC